jgi:hypothetical protein
MDVIFNKLAKYELDDAVEYYELEVPGLGLICSKTDLT